MGKAYGKLLCDGMVLRTAARQRFHRSAFIPSYFSQIDSSLGFHIPHPALS
jgi:hypothetical protein